MAATKCSVFGEFSKLVAECSFFTLNSAQTGGSSMRARARFNGQPAATGLLGFTPTEEENAARSFINEAKPRSTVGGKA